jgi:hypothetical protein
MRDKMHASVQTRATTPDPRHPLVPLVVHVVEVTRALLAVARAAQVAVWGWQLAGPAHSLGEFGVC